MSCSESGRDISEKIALGLAKPSLSKESMYDARLFNQSEGIGSGFKDDDGMYCLTFFCSAALGYSCLLISLQHI